MKVEKASLSDVKSLFARLEQKTPTQKPIISQEKLHIASQGMCHHRSYSIYTLLSSFNLEIAGNETYGRESHF